MGITSELFQNEREQNRDCQFARVPNDTQNFDAADALTGTTAIQNFANFQRFLAPPKPSSDRPGGPGPSRGVARVRRHRVRALSYADAATGDATVTALRNQAANLFSDLLLHDMGEGLADGVSQGQADREGFPDLTAVGAGTADLLPKDGGESEPVGIKIFEESRRSSV